MAVAVQFSPRAILRVLIVLGLLGVLLAGSLVPGWFGGDSEPTESASATTELVPPATTLVPVDIRPAPATTEPLVELYLGLMLDGRTHVLRADDPAVFFVAGVPLEIRRIDGLAANGSCDGLRQALDRWLPIAEALDELEQSSDDDESTDDPARVLEVVRQASVYARAAFDALATLGCG